MNKLIVIFFGLIFHSCIAQTSKVSTEDLKKCSVSETNLENGFVKKYKVSTPNNEFVMYDVIRKKGKLIYSNRYLEDFKLYRKDIFEISELSWSLISRISFGENDEEISTEIILPQKISFDPKEVVGSELISYPSQSVKVIEKVELTLNQMMNYKCLGEEILCVKYDLKSSKNVIDTNTNTVIQEQNTIGFSLFGEDIGWFFMEIESGDLLIKYELEETLTLDEFEKVKMVTQ